MRTYGRVPVVDANGIQVVCDGVPQRRWVVVESENGFDDAVWLTTLCQVLLLNLNESPFYADWGIPAKQSVLQQVPPDFWVTFTQQRFAQRFASLIVARVPNTREPTYTVNVITNQGFRLNFEIGIPF